MSKRHARPRSSKISRRLLAAMVGLALAVTTAAPALADDLVVDADLLTAGAQSTVSLTASPGQVQNVPVDLFVSCKTRQHMAGTVIVTLDTTASTVPAGGTMSSTGTTIAKPAGWPADNNDCGTAQSTGVGHAILQVGAPAAAGTYTYKARWSSNDPDVSASPSTSQVSISLTVSAPAPDSTPPVITHTVSGTLGNNGWYTSDVTVTWSITDPESAVVIDSGCGVQSFTAETAGSTSGCQAHSAGGSASDSVPFKLDKTGPTAVLTPSGTLGQNGWYTSAVVLHASGQDAVSGGVTCTADQAQSAETTGATFNAACTNAAGLSTTAAPLTVKVDLTGPSASLAVTAGTPGTNGWYTSDVTTHASGSDAVSGGVTCTPDQSLTTDTFGTVVAATCTNGAGLATAASPLTVKLDKSDPSAHIAVTAGTLGADGWYTDDVTLHASGSDDVSDPTTCDPDQYQTTDTTGHVFTASCTNDAGRAQAAAPVTVKRDSTPPTAQLEVVGTPGDNGWYTSAVTVRTVGADPTSGITCTADQQLSSESARTVVTGYCTNGAGLRTDAVPVTVKIDLTAPTAVTVVSTGTLGANGWYTSAVTVHTTGDDSVSAPVVCEADQRQSTETTGHDFTGTCTDAAGLSTVSAPVTVRVDESGPSASLAASGTLGLNGWYVSDVTIGTSGQDPVSGGVSCTADQQQTTETTGVTFHGSCTNAAGLTTQAAPLTVKVDTTGPAATLSADRAPDAGGWYTANVTVRTDGSDDVSGPVTCSPDAVLSTDTAGTEVHGSCTNGAGLSTDAAPLTVRLDETNPTAALSVAQGTLGDNGWYVDDVTVHTSGADPVSDPTTCTADQSLTTDTSGQVFNGSCTNSAQLTQQADPLTVKRDATPPTAHLVVHGTPGANGWYVSDVTVTVEGADPTSAVTCVGGASLTSETQGVEVTGSCTNGAGLRTDADPVIVKIDKTAPTASLAVTGGTVGDNGWYVSDVTVGTSGNDDVSGPVVCTADQQQADETSGTAFHGSCTDQAGLVGHADALSVRLDKSAPETTLAVTAGTPGDNGWYTSDVTVHTSGTDPVSGGVSCTDDQQQTTETPGHDFTGTCTNDAGLTSSDALTVKLDLTGPTAAQSTSGRQGAHGWFTDDVTVSTSGSDNVSGPVTCTADRTQTAETKGRTFDASCTDRAGLRTDAAPVTVKMDRTAPSALLSADGPQGSNGWFTGVVTVATTGDDDISGPVTCDPSQQLTTDTAGTVVHGSCTNEAGLSGQAVPLTVKLDTSNPSANLSVSHGTLGAQGWYVDDVTVHTSGADNVSDPTTCSADQLQTTDTDAAGHEFAGSCTDDAGRTQQAVPLTVRRDASPPTAHMEVVDGTLGAHGWYTSPVTVRAVGADPQSGVTCTGDVTVASDTAGTSVTGSCTNGAGITTAAEPLTIRLDTTAPSAQLAVTAGTPGSNGWYTSDVTVSSSGSDSISGPVVCTADQHQTTQTQGTTFLGMCTNDAGLSTAATSLTVKLDETPPSANLAVTAGTTGNNGWYVTPVTVGTSGADDVSSPVTCTGPQTVSGDTSGTTLTGSCTNAAGLVGQATPRTVKIDGTPPVVTVIGLDATYTVGSVPTPSCTTSDATSGVAVNATASVPVLSTVGTFTVTCGGASDRAGNVGMSTATSQSIYGWNGFLQPINDTAHQVSTSTSIFKAGSTVPAKFQLFRSDGTLITPALAPQWLTPVRGSATSASVDESLYSDSATSGSSFRYDTTSQQWIYNWSTKGLSAGYYYRIGVRLDDGQTYYVNIGLR